MAVRNKRPCNNCPPPTSQFMAPKITRPPVPTPEHASVKFNFATSEEEGLRLWKHVLFGTSSCIGMIEGYTLLAMPGNPLEALVQMRDRLNTVIHQTEGRLAHVATLASEKQQLPAGQDHAGPPDQTVGVDA